MLIKNKEKEHI